MIKKRKMRENEKHNGKKLKKQKNEFKQDEISVTKKNHN